MKELRITPEVAKAVVDAGTVKNYRSTQTVRKPPPFEPAATPRDARVFEYIEKFELVHTQKRLGDAPGVPMFFGSPCNFFENDYRTFEEARNAFNSKAWRYTAYYSDWVESRVLYDETSRSKPYERFNWYQAQKITSEKRAETQHGQWLHDGLPTQGLALAPAPLELVAVDYNARFYDVATPWERRYIANRRCGRLGDYVIVAVPPQERKEAFEFATGDVKSLAVVAMFAPCRFLTLQAVATRQADGSYIFESTPSQNSPFHNGLGGAGYKFERGGGDINSPGDDTVPFLTGVTYNVRIEFDGETILSTVDPTDWWTLTPTKDDEKTPDFPEYIERGRDPETGNARRVYLGAYNAKGNDYYDYGLNETGSVNEQNLMNLSGCAMRVTWRHGKWEGEILGR